MIFYNVKRKLNFGKPRNFFLHPVTGRQNQNNNGNAAGNLRAVLLVNAGLFLENNERIDVIARV